MQTQNVGGDVDTYIVTGPRWNVTINEQLSPAAARGDAAAMAQTIGGRVQHIVAS